ncbi:MAG: hypothetical protein R3Y53_09805 [Bacillota bacterium]
MKRFKKNIYKAFSVVLVVPLFAGCGTSSTTPTSTSNVSENSENSVSSAEEEITITYWDAFCGNMEPDSYCELLLEAVWPIDIQVVPLDNLDSEGIKELLTEENMPDVMWYNGTTQYMEELGLTRTIPREMVEEYAPSFIELYDTYPTIYTSIMDLDNKDEFLALNGAVEQSAAIAGSLYADFYRYDWIETLGIELDMGVTQISDNFYVADTGPTLEKFEEIMHAFTYGDPDGNGIDDTYGASFEYVSRFDLLYSGFDLISGVNEENGRAEMYYATENFKEFTKWFKDLFDKGYIDPAFFYQDRTARWETVNQEKAGYFLESSIAINSWAAGRPPLSVIEQNPSAKFLITPGLSDADGHGTIIKNAMPTYGQLCYINKDVDDEKLAMILQLLEYANFGDDKISLWFGEENVDWKYDENGKVVDINAIAAAVKGSRVFVQNVMVDELFEAISVQELFEEGADFWLYDCIWKENDRERYQYKLDLQQETNYSDLHFQYNSPSVNVFLQYFEDWIYNDLYIEGSWHDYQEDLEEAGYRIMMDELDKVSPTEQMIIDFTID